MTKFLTEIKYRFKGAYLVLIGKSVVANTSFKVVGSMNIEPKDNHIYLFGNTFEGIVTLHEVPMLEYSGTRRVPIKICVDPTP